MKTFKCALRCIKAINDISESQWIKSCFRTPQNHHDGKSFVIRFKHDKLDLNAGGKATAVDFKIIACDIKKSNLCPILPDKKKSSDK